MVTRIGGLASGMDIDSFVAKLMSAERAPLYKLQQQKTKFEWQRDSYRSVNTKLKTFEDYVKDNFRYVKDLGKKEVTVSDSTNVSVTAGSTAQGNLSISSITSLATAAKVNGSLNGQTSSQRLASKSDSLATMMGSGAPAELTFTLNEIDSSDPNNPVIQNPKEIKIDTSQSIESILTQLNKEAGLTASFNEKTGQFSFGTKANYSVSFDDATSKNALDNLGMNTNASTGQFTSDTKWINESGGSVNSKTRLGELGLTDGSFTISVPQANGKNVSKEIKYKATDSVEDLLKTISGAGATALVGSDGKISITANATGEGNITFSGLDSTLSSMLNDSQIGGTDAKFIVNDVEMTSKSNKVTVSGYEIILKNKFNDVANNTPPVTISSSVDTDALVDKIKEFVDTYNGLITDLGGQLKETKYRDYDPLTTEQREGMSESEIKLWETKAKSGLLRNDSIIRDGLTKLRAQFVGQIGGLNDKSIDALSELGITTSNKLSDGGKLQINDEKKLRDAIAKDPNQVILMFANTGKADDVEVIDGQVKKVDSRGIAQRLTDTLANIMKDIEKKAGKTTDTDNKYTIGKSMVDLDSRIERMQKRLVTVEQRYWRQFSAMESAINKANQQSSMFSQG